MYINVIYPDGAAGKVRSSSLSRLIRSGEIVAYKCTEGWVELRRKQENASSYDGPYTRVIIPFF
jgi:hypothetical protein